MKKNKIRFNIIDLILIIAVVGCIFGVAVRYNVADKIGLSTVRDTAEIEFLIMGIRPTSYDAMTKGDVFYLQSTGAVLGTLKEATATGGEAYIQTDDLTMAKFIRDDRVDVRGVIEASGSMTNDGFLLNGTQYLGPGKTVKIRSRTIEVTMTITRISIAE